MNRVNWYNVKFKIYAWLKRKKNPLRFDSEKPRCYVMLAADYGNLGDVAITYAQEAYLKHKYPEHEVVDVPISMTLTALGQLKRIMRPNDIITITGGGNMDDMYFDIELLRQLVVETFAVNKIIIFPQTINFSNNKQGITLRKRAERIYNKHKDLTIIAREKASFDTISLLFPSVKTLLRPDIVMTLDKREKRARKAEALFCLRNDNEKKDNSELLNKIRSYCDENNLKIVDHDTHIGRGGLSVEERIKELERIWQRFGESKFVVTDRLHGMIFAYITGTPVIVLQNNNFKVEHCYHWIENCGYVRLLTLKKHSDSQQVYREIENAMTLAKDAKMCELTFTTD